MGRFVGVHTVPGFSPETLEGATGRLGRISGAQLLRAYSSFAAGKVVCDWEAATKEAVARAYQSLGLPWDEIVAVEAICEPGPGRAARHLLPVAPDRPSPTDGYQPGQQPK